MVFAPGTTSRILKETILIGWEDLVVPNPLTLDQAQIVLAVKQVCIYPLQARI